MIWGYITPGSALRITPGSTHGLYWVSEIEPWSATCKMTMLVLTHTISLALSLFLTYRGINVSVFLMLRLLTYTQELHFSITIYIHWTLFCSLALGLIFHIQARPFAPFLLLTHVLSTMPARLLLGTKGKMASFLRAVWLGAVLTPCDHPHSGSQATLRFWSCLSCGGGHRWVWTFYGDWLCAVWVNTSAWDGSTMRLFSFLIFIFGLFSLPHNFLMASWQEKKTL